MPPVTTFPLSSIPICCGEASSNQQLGVSLLNMGSVPSSSLYITPGTFYEILGCLSLTLLGSVLVT